MRRDKEVERASYKYCTMTDKTLTVMDMRDAFAKGAAWADVNPIYPEGVPMAGDKTPGEILAVMNMLVRISGNAPAMRELRELVTENINNEKEPFYNIDHLRYFRRDAEGKEVANG